MYLKCKLYKGPKILRITLRENDPILNLYAKYMKINPTNSIIHKVIR